MEQSITSPTNECPTSSNSRAYLFITNQTTDAEIINKATYDATSSFNRTKAIKTYNTAYNIAYKNAEDADK